MSNLNWWLYQDTNKLGLLVPLTKEYFWDILGLLRSAINSFKTMKMITSTCCLRWLWCAMGSYKRKNPNRYLWNFDTQMTTKIEYLWSIMHQCLILFATILLALKNCFLVNGLKGENTLQGGRFRQNNVCFLGYILLYFWCDFSLISSSVLIKI
jgi:hypothetical protein